MCFLGLKAAVHIFKQTASSVSVKALCLESTRAAQHSENLILLQYQLCRTLHGLNKS